MLVRTWRSTSYTCMRHSECWLVVWSANFEHRGVHMGRHVLSLVTICHICPLLVIICRCICLGACRSLPHPVADAASLRGGSFVLLVFALILVLYCAGGNTFVVQAAVLLVNCPGVQQMLTYFTYLLTWLEYNPNCRWVSIAPLWHCPQLRSLHNMLPLGR